MYQFMWYIYVSSVGYELHSPFNHSVTEWLYDIPSSSLSSLNGTYTILKLIRESNKLTVSSFNPVVGPGTLEL